MRHIIMLLYLPAKKVGMSLPKHMKEFDADVYPHWHFLVNCYSQCPKRALHSINERIEIAKKVLSIPIDQIQSGALTCHELSICEG